MSSNATLKMNYAVNHLALAFATFNAKAYQDPCFKELIELMTDKDFNSKYTYAIFTDTYDVSDNAFVPYFHLYYLNSSKKDVILLDDQVIDLPKIYSHHKYYIYNNEELLKLFRSEYPDLPLSHIKSLKEIDHDVPEDD